MSDTEEQAQTTGPFFKTALILWVLALCGAILVLPYVAQLESKGLAAAAANTHAKVGTLLAISTTLNAALTAVAVLAGLWAGRKVGLGMPLIAAILTRQPAPEKTRSTLLIAVAAGIATGFVLIALDDWIFMRIPAVAALVRNVQSSGEEPTKWIGFLASFYGGLDEEILMRLGLLSLLALALRTVARMVGVSHKLALPAGVFWVANILTALFFGVGHLPTMAALAPLTTALVARTIILNGVAGLVFGVLYKRYGLEWAMASHFAGDLVLHVVFA